jgi:hypothetical protein
VDIHDKPYELLSTAAAALDLTAPKKQRPPARLDASSGVPPAPSDPTQNFEPNLALKNWDRERGFVKPVSDFPLADLYVCWNERAIYLGLYAQDVVEDVFYRDKVVPPSDRAEWTVSIGGRSKPIRGRIGAGLEPIFDEPAVRVTNLSGINGNYRNIAAMELPAKLFGREMFNAGDVIEFASTFFTHCRAYEVQWQGRFTLQSMNYFSQSSGLSFSSFSNFASAAGKSYRSNSFCVTHASAWTWMGRAAPARSSHIKNFNRTVFSG